MTFKFILLIFILIFLVSCKTQEAETSGLLEYKNADLGISFEYPVAFKVYNPNADSLRIESDYKKPDSNLLYIRDKPIAMTIFINRINTKPKNQEELDYFIELGKVQIISRQKIGNYELIEFNAVEGANVAFRHGYHLLSDKGTFYIGDNMDSYNKNLQNDGLYQDYRTKFDEILKSIKII